MSPQSPLRVLIVDDEAPARRKILRLLREESSVQIVGEADGGEAAVAAIRKLRPDLVFLDVQMPGLDGFGVIQALNAGKVDLPRVVFITAHDRFALRAFEVHAFDYLLKPVDEQRFREALRRVRIQHEQSVDGFAARLGVMLENLQREKSLPDRLLVQEDSRAYFVLVKEISWVEADRNYVLLHCGRKTHTLRSTLDTLQSTLDPKLFVRINRGTLVRLDAIRELLPWFHGEYKVMLHDDTELRWSRRYVSQRPELLKLPTRSSPV
jgi:two-component system LytT family response regulator